MTISNTDLLLKYVGNGTQTDFALPGGSNSFSANSEVRVSLIRNDGTKVDQVYNTDFTISGDPGTDIVMAEAPAADEYLVIWRESAETQEVDFIGTGAFPSETNERALDKLTRLVQELAYKTRRAILMRIDDKDPDYSLDQNYPTLADRANKYFAWNAQSQPIAATASDLPDIPVSAYMENLLGAGDAEAARGALGFSGTNSTVPTSLIEDGAVTEVKIADDSITIAKLADLVACSIIARSANSTGAPAALQADANFKQLQRYSDALEFDFVKANVNTSVNTGSASIARGEYLSYFSAASANTDATLPSLANAAGQIYRVRRFGTAFQYAVIIKDSGGVEVTRLHTDDEEVHLFCTGAAWVEIHRVVPEIVWTSYTPTITGFGTVTGVSVFVKRRGQNLLGKGYFITGTVAASLASLTLPTGLTINSSAMELASATNAACPNVGQFVGASSANTRTTSSLLAAVTTSTSLLYFGPTPQSVNQLLPTNGSSVLGNSEGCSFRFEIPISGWNV